MFLNQNIYSDSDNARNEVGVTILHDPSYYESSNNYEDTDKYSNKNIQSDDLTGSIQQYNSYLPQSNHIDANKMIHGADLSGSIQNYNFNYESNLNLEYSANDVGVIDRMSSEQQLSSGIMKSY